MIVDVFLYNGEPIAEARLNYLESVVDRFVVVQATHTFSGKRRTVRPLTPHPKVTLVSVNDVVAHDAWATETTHRNAGVRGLTDLTDDATVFVSDVDEIPNKDLIPAIARTLGSTPILSLEQDFYYYNFNWRKPTKWCNAYVTSYGVLRTRSMQSLRGAHHPRVQKAGWHMSYADTADKIREKIESFSHQELNTPQFKAEDHLQRCLREGTDLFLRGPKEDCMFTDTQELPAELQAFHKAIQKRQA
jgi:beta-1,4-mannosyl-glycoprotein beta-1,4-N-acetylglucosaminyltransferase